MARPSFCTAMHMPSVITLLSAADLAVVVEPDKRLLNQCGVMPVSPQKFSHVKAAESQKLVDGVTSPAGQEVIASYRKRRAAFLPQARFGELKCAHWRLWSWDWR